ncbi:MAG TPA: PDZ domain-containing protein, partial [Anaerolineaceae bacterium]|nr:PDZ domain-containing protein [Anaerolineaceae bacterium]
PSITFGRADQVRVGDVVLAIGNPFGVGQTVTMGIVSALGRTHLGINTFENFIQTDAAINPGNSGGALVDAEGNLIGINSAIYSRSGGSLGIGFAIPVTLAKQVMEQIIQHGSVVRGWIGVEVQDITPELAESFRLPRSQGVLITGVLRGGPADKAGIKPGDILVAIGGREVTDSTEMLNLIATLPPGRTADLRILRNQMETGVRVAVGKRPKMRSEE